MENTDKLISPNEDRFNYVCDFIRKVGKAAHRYGSTSIQLESYLTNLTNSLGYQGIIKVTSNEIIFSFQLDKHSHPLLYLDLLEPSDFNMHRLSLIEHLIQDVIDQKVELAVAINQLLKIEEAVSPWGIIPLALSFSVAGGSFALMLSGSLADVILSAVLGLVVFVLQPVISQYGGKKASKWSPIITSFIIGVLTATAKIYWQEINIVTSTVSALIILIPGFSISIGLIEVFNNHVLSGWSNIMNGLLYLVKLFVGTWLGVLLISTVHQLPVTNESTPIDIVYLYSMLPFILLALCIVFQISKQHLLAVCLICLSSLLGMVGGSILLGTNFGNFIGTVLPVVLSNIWSRKTRQPNSIPLLPSLMLIVSGSIGFRGLAYFSLGEIIAGQQSVVQMFIVAVTMGAGILVGNTLSRTSISL
ncbi:threonine/serine exporter family protein [Flammeovirga agarivorans]|uniref:Threonine/serine exporter family protein n=1 Tax=Flammeovirga agarivorans TaxID=2726742 RepID=A0A7X8SNH6_9BACT|nr:threonine/serine exporter family protein [Flammeovirga agarivorans]NLR93478.1 threonine/serine exporter family protein [Flammeovirga agarivorans]